MPVPAMALARRGGCGGRAQPAGRGAALVRAATARAYIRTAALSARQTRGWCRYALRRSGAAHFGHAVRWSTEAVNGGHARPARCGVGDRPAGRGAGSAIGPLGAGRGRRSARRSRGGTVGRGQHRQRGGAVDSGRHRLRGQLRREGANEPVHSDISPLRCCYRN